MAAESMLPSGRSGAARIARLEKVREEHRRLEGEVAKLRCVCGHTHEDHRYVTGLAAPRGCSVEVDRYEKCSCMRFKAADA